jgi:hypothetical protein
MHQDNSAASAGRRVPRMTTRRFRRKWTASERTVAAPSPARQEVRVVIAAHILPAARSVRTVPAPPASPLSRTVIATVEAARTILRAERVKDQPLLDFPDSGLERPARRQRTSTPPPESLQFDPAADSIRLDTQARLAHQELYAEGIQRLLEIHSRALYTSHARILALEEALRLRGNHPPPPLPEPTDGSPLGSNVLGLDQGPRPSCEQPGPTGHGSPSSFSFAPCRVHEGPVKPTRLP